MSGMWRLLSLCFLLPFFISLLAPGEASAVTNGDVAIQMVTSPILTIDSNDCAGSGPHASYVAFEVQNTTAAPLTDLEIELQDLDAGGGFQFSGGQAPKQFVGTLAPEQTNAFYWFISYPCTDGLTDNITVVLTDTTPSSATLGAAVTTDSQVSSSAGGDFLSSILGPGAVVGQTIEMQVVYEYGNIGTGAEVYFQPAGNTDFNAGCLQLISTKILSSDLNSINAGTMDRLYFVTTASTNGSGNQIEVLYRFRYRCEGVATTAIPFAAATSGGPIKYTGNFETIIPISFPPADNLITVSKSVTPDSFPTGTGGTVLYTVTVRNESTFPTFIDEIEDVLPAGVVYDAIDAGSQVTAANSSRVPNPGATGTLRWEAIPETSYQIAAGDSIRLVYSATIPPTDGVYFNRALAAIGFSATGTDSARVQVGTFADLEVLKTGPATAVQLDTLTYLITTTNLGADDADNVLVVDTLPAGITFVGASRGALESAGIVTWPAIASLANGASVVDTVRIFASAPGALLNVASATSDASDANPGNNDGSGSVSQAITLVGPLADISVAKTGPAIAAVGDTLTYVVTTTNLGPDDADGVVVTDNLPTGVTFITASRGGLESGGTVTWPAAVSLLNGASLVDTVRVIADSTGAAVNIASATSITFDAIAGNNDGSDPGSRWTTTVFSALSDLGIVKTGPASVSVGDTVVYVVTVTNFGPSPADSVIVTDTLPPGVSFLGASRGATESGGIVTWPPIHPLSIGASVNDTLRVSADVAGSLVNVSAASSPTVDPDPANNDGSDPGSRASTTVNPEADIAVTKTGPANAAVGDTLTYLVTVTNNGPSPADSVVVVDTLPAGVTFLSASRAASENAGVVTWPVIVTLVNGASTVDTVRVTADADGSLLNIAAATTTTQDPDATNNDGSDPTSRFTTTVSPAADIAVTKTGPANAAVGDTLTYLVTVTNNGPSSAESVVVTDTLPAGATFLSASRAATETAGVVTWPAIVTLANGASTVDTVRVTADADGSLLNIAAATTTTPDPDATNNDGSDPGSRVTTTVSAVADIAVTKTGPANAAAGDTLTYLVTVTNNGPSDAAGVVVSDTLPAGVTFLSASRAAGESGGVITWPGIATLANGASVVDTVRVSADTDGILVNVAGATSTTSDPDPGNNDGSDPASRFTTTVSPVADIAVTKTGPASATVSDTLTYIVTATNIGPSDADSVVVTDTLPAGVTFLSASRAAVENAGVVTWPAILTLAGGASSVDTVRVLTGAPGSLENVVAGTTTTPDPNAANNDGSAPGSRVTTSVTATAADLEILKSGPGTAAVGDTLTFVLTTTNLGPDGAESVIVTDTLPAGLAFLSATRGAVESAGTVTWPAITPLANGASLTDTVMVVAAAPGSWENVASATSTTGDPDPGNNDGSDPGSRITTGIVPVADIAVVKTGPLNASVGDTLTYVISVSNNGPNDADNVAVTDLLPAGTVFLSASRGATEFAGLVTWPSVPLLANGGSMVDTVRALAAAEGTLLNEARANTSTLDPDLGNNNGSDPASRVSTLVTAVADLEVLKSGPANAVVGDTLTYVITATNNGPSDAGDVVITDTLPGGVSFLSASRGGVEAGGVITFPAVNPLAAGSALVDTVRVLVTGTGVLVNTASGTSSTTDPDPGNNDGSEPGSRTSTTVFSTLADISVTKTGPVSAALGDTITYVITVTNAGPSDADSMIVEDALPAGVTFIGATRGGTEAGGLVTWPAVHPLPNGASVTDTVRVLADAPGTLLNVASATTTTLDPNAANNDGSDPGSRVNTVVDAVADIALVKTGPVTALVGDTLTYVITVTNNGPGDADDVVVTDTLPAGVNLVSATRGATETGGVVTWPAINPLVNGASVVDTVRVLAVAAGNMVNTARATSSTTDPDPGNNDGSGATNMTTTAVTNASADLRMIKTGPAVVSAGDTLTYLLDTANLGPSEADNVVVTDTLPAGVQFLNASRGGLEAGGIVSWPSLAVLANGASVVDTVRVLVPTSGTFVNIASATSATPDPDPANNDGSNPGSVVTTTVDGWDVALSKTLTGALVIDGTADYVLALANLGPGNAPGPFTITDPLPPGLAFVSGNGSGWSVSATGPVVTATRTTPLAAGDTSTVVLTVRVDAGAPASITNIATAGTPGDSGSGNNQGSVTSSVNAAEPLILEKSVSPAEIEIGEFVSFTIRVENPNGFSVPAVEVRDTLPAGFKFVSGTARLDNAAVPDPSGSPGPMLVFDLGTLSPLAAVSLSYRVFVGPGAALGDRINRAQAFSPPLGTVSNLGQAQVQIRQGVFTDEGYIQGKIFVDGGCAGSDSIQGSGDLGIPGVRLYLEDGSSVVTDVEGKFHFYGIRPRTHVLKVDTATLPPGARLLTLSNRHAGSPSTRFVDLKRGELHRADFAVAFERTVVEAVTARRRTGEVTSAGGAAADPNQSERRGEVYSSILPNSKTTAYDSNLPGSPAAGSPWVRGSEETIEVQVPPGPVVADGSTMIPVRIRLPEGDSVPHVVTLESTRGVWQVHDQDAGAPGIQVRLDEREGEFLLASPDDTETARIRVTGTSHTGEAEVAFLPASQKLQLTGLIEGRADFRSKRNDELGALVVRDRFEDPLRDVSTESDDGKSLAGGRAALFAKGDIGKGFGLTFRYDSEDDPGARIFRDIRPEEFYPVYGDASIKGFDAQSTGPVFGKIDRGRSHLLYGDFNTAGSSGARQLGAYHRSLTGVQHHLEFERISLNAMASRGTDRQVIDEIPGQGISGPYALSQPSGLVNSERVEIITRDRNQPAVILAREHQVRFADYSLEPLTGRLIFRRPVPSVDSELNPVFIRVTYEAEAGGEKFWVYGADAQLNAGSRLSVGGSAVRDDQPGAGMDLFSVNASVGLTPSTFLTGEFARTDSSSGTAGDAKRLELRQSSAGLDARVFWLRTDTAFDNPSTAFGRGREEVGVRASGLVDDRTRLFGEAIRTEDLLRKGHRKGLQVGASRRLDEMFDVELGYRFSEETSTPASLSTESTTPNRASSVRARVGLTLPEPTGVSLFGVWEQDLRVNEQHRGIIGGKYRLHRRTRVYAQHELISSLGGPFALNPDQEQNNTVIGLESDYLEDTRVFSEYRVRDAFAGREAQAAIGLRNRWQLSPGVVAHSSFERVSPLSGSSGNDATAVTGALEYTARPGRKGTARLEFRDAVSGSQWFASLGYGHKLTRDFTVFGRSHLAWMVGERLSERSRVGLAYRQTDGNRWHALARYEHKLDRDAIDEPLEARDEAHVLSAHVNVAPVLPLELRGQLATKWAKDKEDGFDVSSSTHLAALRGTYDLNSRLDVGLHLRGLFADGFGDRRTGVGAEIGVTVAENLRAAGGYNVFGFHEDDLAGESYTDQGAYLSLGFKFDETLIGLDRPRQPSTENEREHGKHATTSVDSTRTSLSTPGERITDSAIATDYWVLNRWENRLQEVIARDGGLSRYHIAKAQAWLDLARREYEENDRSGIVEAAFTQATDIIRTLDRGSTPLGWNTPIVTGSSRVHQDRWAEIDRLKQHPGFDAIATDVARLEVALVGAGNDSLDCVVHAVHGDLVVPRIPISGPKPEPADPTGPAPEEQAEPIGDDPRAPMDPQVVEIPNVIHFASDESYLSAASKKVLDEIARILIRYPDIRVELYGHTDSRASYEYNLALSENRANTVTQYLLRWGVNHTRITLSYEGEYSLKRSGDRKLDLARNRRVELRYSEPDGIRVVTVEQEEDLQP